MGKLILREKGLDPKKQTVEFNSIVVEDNYKKKVQSLEEKHKEQIESLTNVHAGIVEDLANSHCEKVDRLIEQRESLIKHLNDKHSDQIANLTRNFNEALSNVKNDLDILTINHSLKVRKLHSYYILAISFIILGDILALYLRFK